MILLVLCTDRILISYTDTCTCQANKLVNIKLHIQCMYMRCYLPLAALAQARDSDLSKDTYKQNSAFLGTIVDRSDNNTCVLYMVSRANLAQWPC